MWQQEADELRASTAAAAGAGVHQNTHISSLFLQMVPQLSAGWHSAAVCQPAWKLKATLVLSQLCVMCSVIWRADWLQILRLGV